jgi:2-iminobutanoate/2-iminopropanoate deaminase
MAKQVLSTGKAGPPLGAYSQGFRVGDFIYTAGTGPIDPETGKISGETLEEQTRRTLDNIKAVLEAAGATMDDVFKCNVFLANPGMFPRFNAVYAEYFKDPKPARTTVGAHLDQVPGMLIEIEAIAYVGKTPADTGSGRGDH